MLVFLHLLFFLLESLEAKFLFPSIQMQHTFFLLSISSRRCFAAKTSRCRCCMSWKHQKQMFWMSEKRLGFRSSFNGILKGNFHLRKAIEVITSVFETFVALHNLVTQSPFQINFQCSGVCYFYSKRVESLVMTSSHESTIFSTRFFLSVLFTASITCCLYFFNSACTSARLSKVVLLFLVGNQPFSN